MGTRTTENDKLQDAEYAAAFNEDAPAPVAQTEDEAFGITAEDPAAAEAVEEPVAAEEAAAEIPEEIPGSDAPADGGEPVVALNEDEAGAGDQPGEAEAAPVALGEGEADDLADVPPEDLQKAKSWIGRLRKREAELAAREAAVKDGAPADGGGVSGAEAADDMIGHAEEVIENSDSFAQAVAVLSEDYGDQFVGFIKAIAERVAAETAGQSGKNDEALSIIAELRDELDNYGRSEHWGYIKDMHPDAEEILNGEGFSAWASDKPEWLEVCESGNKRDVVKMLAAFKKSQDVATDGELSGETDPEIDEDDAIGVRSAGGGMRIPERVKPADKDDFANAWKEF